MANPTWDETAPTWEDTAPAQAPNGGSSQWDVVKQAAKMANAIPRPWDVARQNTIDPMAQSISDAGLATGYPRTGAAIGTALKISPEILAAYGSLRGLYNSDSPVAKAIVNTPKQIGQQMNVGEQAAGVTDQLPIRAGSVARFPKSASEVMTVTPGGTAIPPNNPMNSIPDIKPMQYPKNTNALLNFIQSRIAQFGENLSPQELSDYKKILPEMFNKAEVVRGTPQYAMASDINGQIGDLYNKAIAGRESLNQAYSLAKTLHPDLTTPIMNFIQKYGKQALKEAIGVGLGVGAAKSLSK